MRRLLASHRFSHLANASQRRVGGVRMLLVALAFLPMFTVPGEWRQDLSPLLPGDHNYPVLNTDAHQTVHIKARLPDTLDIRFVAVYRTTPPPAKKTPCGHWVGWDAQVSAPLTVLVPLEMAGNGPAQESTALADRFERGACGWAFRGISFKLAGSAHDGLALDLVANFSDSAPVAAPTTAALWCAKGLNPFRPGVWCSPAWTVFTKPWRHWKDDARRVELMKRVPSDQWNVPGGVVVPLDTNDLTLDFYDIDAIVTQPQPAG
jgi:hypothetical protein